MRRIILVVATGAVLAGAGAGIGVASATTRAVPVEAVPVSSATQAAAADDAKAIPPRTIGRRHANEALDGDPRSPDRWGPAQWESFQVAARGVFDKLGQVTPVAAQREGAGDTYQIIVKARDGHEYRVEVDYLRFQLGSVAPLG